MKYRTTLGLRHFGAQCAPIMKLLRKMGLSPQSCSEMGQVSFVSNRTEASAAIKLLTRSGHFCVLSGDRFWSVAAEVEAEFRAFERAVRQQLATLKNRTTSGEMA